MKKVKTLIKEEIYGELSELLKNDISFKQHILDKIEEIIEVIDVSARRETLYASIEKLRELIDCAPLRQKITTKINEILNEFDKDQRKKHERNNTTEKNLVTELNELIDEHSYMVPPEELYDIKKLIDADDQPLSDDDGSFLLIKASIFKTLVKKAIEET